MNLDPTKRFSNRVELYLKYRPKYPPEIIEILSHDTGLTPACVIADIGSGTGLFSELFLKNGNSVFGVEPNAGMRQAAEKLLHTHSNFKSISGTAEHTSLKPYSIDFVSAAQAFHWFDPSKTKKEFARILKPMGVVILIWNDRKTNKDLFSKAYERLVQTYGIDYQQIGHNNIHDPAMHDFFGPRGFSKKTFTNHQRLDFDGLKGRLLSSSYIPDQGHPQYDAMIQDLQKIFHDYSMNWFQKQLCKFLWNDDIRRNNLIL